MTRRRPDCAHRRIKTVLYGGVCRYYQQNVKPLSMTRGAVATRKWRLRLTMHVDCRICSRCKYAFISRAGVNVCSICYEEARQAYKTYFLKQETSVRVSLYRAWASDTGFFPYAEETRKPKYPVPDLDRIKPNIDATFDQMKAWKRESYCGTMPRVVGLKPYLDVQPIRDLRVFNGKKVA